MARENYNPKLTLTEGTSKYIQDRLKLPPQPKQKDLQNALIEFFRSKNDQGEYHFSYSYDNLS